MVRRTGRLGWWARREEPRPWGAWAGSWEAQKQVADTGPVGARGRGPRTVQRPVAGKSGGWSGRRHLRRRPRGARAVREVSAGRRGVWRKEAQVRAGEGAAMRSAGPSVGGGQEPVRGWLSGGFGTSSRSLPRAQPGLITSLPPPRGPGGPGGRGGRVLINPRPEMPPEGPGLRSEGPGRSLAGGPHPLLRARPPHHGNWADGPPRAPLHVLASGRVAGSAASVPPTQAMGQAPPPQTGRPFLRVLGRPGRTRAPPGTSPPP